MMVFVLRYHLYDVYIILGGHESEDLEDVEDLGHVKDDGGQEDGKQVGHQDPDIKGRDQDSAVS